MDTIVVDVIAISGPPGPSGPPGMTVTINGSWDWQSGAQTGAISNNKVGLDNDTPAQANWIHISAVANGGKNYGAMIRRMQAGSQVYIWDPADNQRWGTWRVAAAPEDNGTWFRIPVAPLDWQGGEPQQNNADVEVALVFAG